MDVEAVEDALQELAVRLDRPFSPSGDPDEVCMASDGALAISTEVTSGASALALGIKVVRE